MDGTHTKLDENDATIFHSHPCSFLSMLPLSVAVFRGNCRFLFSREGEQPERLFYDLGDISSVLLVSNRF